jgi:hypothetical protein
MRSARLVALLLGGLGVGACATGGAHVIEDKPTLAVPPVPPRTIEPQPMVELPPVAPMPESNPVAAAPPKPRPAPRNTESKPAEPKPEATPEATAALPTPPPVAALRPPTAPTGADELRQIRETLQRADGILAKVDYQKLSPDRRGTYDSAKNYMRQAEEKIKQDDLLLARAYAIRAEEIAKRLLETGR